MVSLRLRKDASEPVPDNAGSRDACGYSMWCIARGCRVREGLVRLCVSCAVVFVIFGAHVARRCWLVVASWALASSKADGRI